MGSNFKDFMRMAPEEMASEKIRCGELDLEKICREICKTEPNPKNLQKISAKLDEMDDFQLELLESQYGHDECFVSELGSESILLNSPLEMLDFDFYHVEQILKTAVMASFA